MGDQKEARRISMDCKSPTCAGLTLIFGIVFILLGMDMVAIDPWLVVGVMFAIFGLMPLLGIGKK